MKPRIKIIPDKDRVEKAFDDIVSRLTSYRGWKNEPEIIKKFKEEIQTLFLSEQKLPELVEKIYDMNIQIKNNRVFCDNPKFSLDSHIPFVINLRNIYPSISDQGLIALTMIYWIQKSLSGSNWSPSMSYPDIVEYYENGWGIIECFCGLMNNQDNLHGRSVTAMRLALDYETIVKYTGDIKFVGTWPLSAPAAVSELLMKYGKVVMLVNPVYSEPEIILTFKALNEIVVENVIVWMTLPNWDDLYDSDSFKAIMTKIKIIKKKLISNDVMRNPGSEVSGKKVPFSFYSLVIRKFD